MSTIRLFCFYGLMLCFIIACAPSTPSAGQELITWYEYDEMSETATNWQVIDVRTPEEFGEGNIATSKNINFYSEDFEAQLEQLDKTRPIVLYCKSGGRSHKAATRCKELGFANVYDVEGGYNEWKSRAKEVTEQ